MGTMVFQMGAARKKSHYWDIFGFFSPIHLQSSAAGPPGREKPSEVL